MQLLDSYPLPPGCCALCKGNATPLIDTELHTDDLPVEFAVEQSGWAYICVQCVMHMATMMGGVAPEQAERMTAAMARVVRENERVTATLVATQQALDALTALNAGYAPAQSEVAHAAH